MKSQNPIAANWSELDRNAPTFAASVDIISITPGRTEIVRLSNANATFLNANGEKLSEAVLQIEERPEDVVGVLPFSIDSEILTVYATECLRPALGGREIVGLPPLGDDKGGRVINELGGYLTNVDGIAEAAQDVLQRKSGLKPSGPFEFFGHIVTPNAPVSGELAVSLAVLVEPPEKSELLLDGNNFDASRVVRSLTAQEVTHHFFSGQLSDLRFFDDVTELHAVLKADRRITNELSAPSELVSKVQNRLSKLAGTIPANLPILQNAQTVRDFLDRPSAKKTNVVAAARVRILDDCSPTQSSRFKSLQLKVQNRSSKGTPVGQSYAAEAIVRSHDVLHLVVLTKNGLMPVNIGARAPLEVRDGSPHVIHTQTRARNLENPWGSLECSYQDEAAVTKQIRDILKRRTGLDLSGDPILTSIQGYNSPGFNTSGARYAICFVELDENSAAKLPADTAFVRPETLIEAQVRDLPLRIAARVAAMSCGRSIGTYERILAPEERTGFNKLILADNEFDRFIRKFWPQLRELMQKKPILDSISSNLVRRDGWEIVQPDSDDPEKYFFNSLMQGFAVHPGDNPLRVLQLVWHDYWHYSHPDPIPFERDAAGKLQLISFDEYRHAVMQNEINAVMFSDVILPYNYGIEEFERDSGLCSLASLLKKSGITQIDDQRAAIALSLETGKLHPAIINFLKTSGKFADYEPVLREKLLGYYVRDTLKNVRVQYDAWETMPKVAEVALRLGVHMPSQMKVKNFSDLLERLTTDDSGRSIATGRNNLSQAIGKLKTYSVYRDTLRLAYLANEIEKLGKQEHLDEISLMIERLVGAHSQLDATVSNIVSIEESPENSKAYRLMEQVRGGVAAESEALVRLLVSEAGPFSEEMRKALRSRIQHLPFPLLSFDPREDRAAQEQVTELLKDVLDK